MPAFKYNIAPQSTEGFTTRAEVQDKINELLSALKRQ